MHVQTIQLNQPLKNVRLAGYSFEGSPVAESNVGAPDTDATRLQQANEEIKELRTQVETLQAKIASNQQANRAIAEVIKQLERVDSIRQKTLVELQHVAIEMASAIAVKICQTKIDQGDFPFENVVNSLIDRLGFSQPMKIHLHPLDLKEIEPKFLEQHRQRQIEFFRDPQLDRGECRAETEDAGLISTIDLQAAEMRQLLWEGLDAAQSAT